MAIELLLHAPPHRVIHDAESLIFVLIFLCTHLDGPGSVGSPPVFGSRSEHPSGVRDWLSATNLMNLGHIKFSQMNAHLSIHILRHLSPYFSSLQQVISTLWTALFPSSAQMSPQTSHSDATLRDFIDVLKTLLLDEKLKETANLPGNRQNLKRPGDSFLPGCGWDPFPAPKKLTKAKINSSAPLPKASRGKSVLNKSQHRSKSRGK